MTVVVGAVDGDGRVVMASDTGSVGALITYGARKIIHHRAADGTPFLLGFAGVSAMKDVAERHLRADGVPEDPWLLLGWVQGVAEQIGQLGADARPSMLDEDGNVRAEALLGIRGTLWQLNQQAVFRIDTGVWAVGSGAGLALGYVLGASGPGRSVETVLRAAVDVACRYDDCCCIESPGSAQVEVLP